MKKNLDDPKFWDAFGRGLPVEMPTPAETSEHVFKLLARVKAAEEDATQARHEAKCAKQQFGIFLMEVGNVARKYETI